MPAVLAFMFIEVFQLFTIIILLSVYAVMIMIATIMYCKMKEGTGAKFFMISYTVCIVQSIQLEMYDTAD